MISFKDTLTFSADTDLPVELINFWPPEAGFVWSTGRWCEMMFDFSDADRRVEQSDLIFDIDAFKREGDTSMVAFYLNGLRIGTTQIRGRLTLVINFETAILRKTGNILVIDTPESCSPADIGLSDDRLLGIQLFSVQVRPC
jgi:hypothetical protein